MTEQRKTEDGQTQPPVNPEELEDALRLEEELRKIEKNGTTFWDEVQREARKAVRFGRNERGVADLTELKKLFREIFDLISSRFRRPP